MYERDLVAGLNNDFYVVIDDVDDVIDDVDAIIDDVVISDDFHKCQDGLVKKLTEYDVQTSSLYLHSNFATQFWVKGRKRFYKDNILATGDAIKFIIDNGHKNVIHWPPLMVDLVMRKSGTSLRVPAITVDQRGVASAQQT
ncbi:hypothetical protein DEO72_LG9g1085 [Vigna unguiculata]|uniref:Uncharacterized protein n=1 Tax=Vigna unguiculata TaxID=3917 RepID=A0A4D6MX99_VIGUN|nr:hypothetical protein DEO72_LG9g1085 [Vigna unguiculata]